MPTSPLKTQALPVNTSVDLAAKFLTSGVTKFYKNVFWHFFAVTETEIPLILITFFSSYQNERLIN